MSTSSETNQASSLERTIAAAIAAVYPDLSATLSAEQVARLAQLTQSFIDHGKEYGLTGLSDPDDIIRELIVDSLAAAALIPANATVADLGSGGGIPGLPLAIVCSTATFTLVEAQQRKVKWINEQIAALELGERVEGLAERLEDVARLPKLRATFDVVTAKALSALPSLIELGVPLLKVNGYLLAYKGIKAAEEVQASAVALKKLKASLEPQLAYALDERARVICLVRKNAPTPGTYPRRMGLPQHKPLL